MTEKIADVCDHCGKTVVKALSMDSSGMLSWSGTGESYDGLLFMRDLRAGENNRPLFRIVGKHWCPSCLLKALKSWIDEVAD